MEEFSKKRRKNHLKEILSSYISLQKEATQKNSSKEILEDLKKTDQNYVSYMKLQKILTKAYQDLAKKI